MGIQGNEEEIQGWFRSLSWNSPGLEPHHGFPGMLDKYMDRVEASTREERRF